MTNKVPNIFWLSLFLGLLYITSVVFSVKPVHAETNISCGFNNCGGKLIQFYPGKAFTLFDRLYFYARGNDMIDVYYCDRCGLVQKK